MEKQFKNELEEYLASNEYREYLDTLEKCQAEYEIKSKEIFESLEYDQRMYVAFHLYKQLYENEFIDQGSYRHLIYTKLGFSTDAYSSLMDSGLMSLHNSIFPHDDVMSGIKAIFKFLDIEYDNKLINKAFCIFNYGSYEPSYQLKFHFDEE